MIDYLAVAALGAGIGGIVVGLIVARLDDELMMDERRRAADRELEWCAYMRALQDEARKRRTLDDSDWWKEDDQ